MSFIGGERERIIIAISTEVKKCSIGSLNVMFDRDIFCLYQFIRNAIKCFSETPKYFKDKASTFSSAV
jgi:hypothetical protein